MKSSIARVRTPLVLFSVLLVSLALIPLVGCMKSGKTAKGNLPPDLVALQEEVGKGKSQIQITIAALEAVVAGKDTKAKFADFEKAMGDLDTQAAAIKKRADDMRSRGTTYFKTWEDQLATVTTPEIKASAEKRRDELAKHYKGVTVATEAARESYNPLLSDLKDVQKMLSNDQSADSVKALAGPVTKIKASGKVTSEKLDVVVKSLNNIGAIYSGTP